MGHKKKTIGSRQAIRFNCLDGETNVKKKKKKTDRDGREVGRSRFSRERIMTAAAAAAVGKEKVKEKDKWALL